MLGLEMLDVAIGVIFVFLLLSLICSAINEMIEAKLKLRAVDLEEGIRQMLNETDTTTLTQKLYDHPLIFSLFRGKYSPKQTGRSTTDLDKNRYKTSSDLPSYIPSKNFAVALMDSLLPPRDASQAAADPKSLQPFRDAANKLDNADLKKALLAIFDAAGNDIDKARAGIENWFNSAMDRVSGWYKRRVQKIVFLMGFGVAIFFNADTIAIFRNLSNDRPLRDAIVSAAKDFKMDTTKGVAVTNKTIKTNVDELNAMGLPIGWGWKSTLNPDPEAVSNIKAIPRFDNNIAASLGGWFLKLFGWFITGMAVSLGAPFWFDVLNKIMVVRSTVKPHEKSPEEGSQDKQDKS